MSRPISGIISALVLSLMVMTSACRSTRQATGTSPVVTGSPAQRLESMGNEYRAKPLCSYSVPVTVNISKPTSVRVSGSLYVKPSKYIFFSARFLGIEVGAVMITPDSIFGKIKPGKLFFAEPLATITNILPFTIDQIQDLIAGRIVLPGYEVIDRNAVKGCRFTENDNTWTVVPANLPAGIDARYIVSSASNHVERLELNASVNSATIKMSEFTSTPMLDLPSRIALNVTTAKTTLNADIEFNYTKLRTDASAGKYWTTPGGYTRVNSQSIIKALSNI